MDKDNTAIAATYDAARGYQPDVLRQRLAIICREHTPSSNVIVDVGCGTGRYANALAERVAARVIGIDPSAKMLAGARANLAETALGSAGEQLTLADGCADMVFLSMILHHLKDCPRQAEECGPRIAQGWSDMRAQQHARLDLWPRCGRTTATATSRFWSTSTFFVCGS